MPSSFHHFVIVIWLLAKKTKYSTNLRATQRPFTDAVEGQPLFVKLESAWQDFADRLVQSRTNSSANFQLHIPGILILLPTVVLTAAIIAGGQGRRLGGLDKSALVVGGRRIIDRQLAVLGQVAEHVLIVSNDHHRFRCSGLRVCRDLISNAGPLSGLYTALVRSPTLRTMVIACDLPFLTAAFLRHLAALRTDAAAVIPRSFVGLQPLCAIYDRACLKPIQNMIDQGDFRMSGLRDSVCTTELTPQEIAQYDPDGTLFLNVNTPYDYNRAIGRLAAGTPMTSTRRDAFNFLHR